MKGLREKSGFDYKSDHDMDRQSTRQTSIGDDPRSSTDCKVLSRLESIETMLRSIFSADGRRNSSSSDMLAADGTHSHHSRLMPNAVLWEHCSEEIRSRILRETYFPELKGEDAAWFILLDLGKSQVERRTVFITDACVASFCPSTTALRHIAFLVDLELCVREVDPTDRRRSHLSLSARGQEKLFAYIRAKQAARKNHR